MSSALGRPDDSHPPDKRRTRRDFGEHIERRYLALLRQANSPLLNSESILTQVVAQLYSILDSLSVGLRWNAAQDSRSNSEEYRMSVVIGKSRATSGANPAQSLKAASMIFEAALPAVSQRLGELGNPTPDRDAALLLNRAIMDRMSVAAMSYIDVLLTKAQGANQDERRRVSRELHDVAAPAVAVALQSLELYEVYAASAPEEADRKLAASQRSMHEVLRIVRELSAELREDVGAIGLAAALDRYLDATPPNTNAELSVEGPVNALSPAYAEEVFLLLREAVRNAVSHAGASNIRVQLSLSANELQASVTDDGTGFDVTDTLARHRHVGLDSMRERAELLGGTLTITSTPKVGTTASIWIPVPPVAS
jgi:signal transduction histidine kinase